RLSRRDQPSARSPRSGVPTPGAASDLDDDALRLGSAMIGSPRDRPAPAWRRRAPRLTATPMPHGAWPAAIGWTRSPAPGVAAPGAVPDVDDDAARLVAGGDRLGETAQLRRGGAGPPRRPRRRCPRIVTGDDRLARSPSPARRGPASGLLGS